MSDVFYQSFKPEGLGETIFRERYARSPEESWEEACERVSSHVAQAEQNGNVERYTNRFWNQLVSGRFSPGGRIWYGCGRPLAQLANCFVVPCEEDSREGWGKVTSDVIVISGMMGGVGINVSKIRPRGSEIRGTGGYATGAVSLMQLINGVGDVIVGGGGRRMALMLSLSLNHPDIKEFLEVKLDRKELNNANISIMIPQEMPTEKFVEAVKNSEEIELIFNGIPSGETINAKWLWDKLVENSWESGEPGVLNSYLMNKMNNISYFKPILGTNPCGEQPLEGYGTCNLGALVLPQFVSDGKFNWDEFDESIRLAIRFLDNVITVNRYPLPEIKENADNVRRIGLGVMGLHTMLLEMGMNYDSSESFLFVDKLFAMIKNTAYDASINLAIERGPFPKYDSRFLESGFVKTLKPAIRNKIREHGIRNCALLTVAPTGTTSLVAGVSSGIEPNPPAVYWRNYYKPTKGGERELTRELVVDETYYKYPELAQSAIDIPVESHFKMQKTVQKHLDSACSKTINLAHDYPKDKFGDTWLEYLPFLKGTTVYRYGSRENEPIQVIPKDQWESVLKEHGKDTYAMTEQEFLDAACPGGVCDVSARPKNK